jgi:hypothetical protein
MRMASAVSVRRSVSGRLIASLPKPFRDNLGRKVIGVRQATQFKGAFKAHFMSVIDDTLRMVPDRVFKLDNQFDFLITAQHVYILHPAGFERVAEIEESYLRVWDESWLQGKGARSPAWNCLTTGGTPPH